MIEAVPTNSPVRVSQVCSGWVRKRASAIASTSPYGTRSRPARHDTHALRERHRGLDDDLLAGRQALAQLDLRESDRPHLHPPALGGGVGDGIDPALLAVAMQ